MKNQSRANKAVPKLPALAGSEQREEYPSLKSVRGSQRNTDDFEQAAAGVPASLLLREDHKETPGASEPVTAWRCPQCKTLNIFGEAAECANCKFNVGYVEDIMSIMIEMTREEFEKQADSSSKIQQPE
jgi:hypothetical protein